MKVLTGIVLSVFVLAFAASAQTDPPLGLSAELMNAGVVELEWLEPGSGLAEDFEDGQAQSFEWFVGNAGSYSIDGGYAKVDMMAEIDDWGTGVYTGMAFGDFTLTSLFERIQTAGNSAGILFCGNGPQDSDYSGYAIYTSNGSWSAWVWTAGVPVNLVGWTANGAIQMGVGAINNLEVTKIGSNIDVYCNGTYLGSFTDGTYADGFAGIATAYENEIWFDDIYCNLAVAGPNAPADLGDLDPVLRDHMGHVITDPAEYYVPGRAFDRFGEDQHAIDDFLNYKVYRDGNLVGEPTTEMYTDQLPSPGMYEYTVTAYYDEGESDPAGPVSVDWVAVYFNLYPTQTTVPQGGGNVVYDVELISTIGASMNGLRYRTYVTLPNNFVYGPVDNIPFNLTPFMNVYYSNLSVTVPGNAPEGNYMFEAVAGHPTNPNLQVSDTFPFQKVGAGWFEDFEDGDGQGMTWFDPAGGFHTFEDGYAKVNTVAAGDWGSGVYTGIDFDDATTTAMFEYSAGDLSRGMLFRGDGPKDSDYTGYGFWIAHTLQSYSVYKYTNGTLSTVSSWTASGAITPGGVGQVNTLTLSMIGSTADMYINGTYVGSFTDATHTSGYSGCVSAYSNDVWYDNMSAVFGDIPPMAQNVDIGVPLEGNYDEFGRPTDEVIPSADAVVFDRSAEINAMYEDFTFNPEDWVSQGFVISSDGDDIAYNMPKDFALEAAYPNPFNPSTTIAVALPTASDLTVNVYNVTGQLVTTLAEGMHPAGMHTLNFDASGLSSGLYFVRATVPGRLDQTQKVMLVR